ncbi:hypothetical protein IWZ01DRAFT_495939 [Phyllosticta capitalensis]
MLRSGSLWICGHLHMMFRAVLFTLRPRLGFARGTTSRRDSQAAVNHIFEEEEKKERRKIRTNRSSSRLPSKLCGQIFITSGLRIMLWGDLRSHLLGGHVLPDEVPSFPERNSRSTLRRRSTAA